MAIVTLTSSREFYLRLCILGITMLTFLSFIPDLLLYGVSDAALGAICEVIDHVADMHELSLRSVSKHVFRLSRVLVRGPYCAASNWFS